MEARLLKWFEELFGSGADTIVAIGDWSQRQHRRFKEPVKGKGFRTMFRKAGYDVYLVDEFCTSSRCSAWEQGECETFRKCENPRPYRSGSIASWAGQVYDLFQAVEPKYERRVEHLEGGDECDPRRGSPRVPSKGLSGA